MATNEWRGRNPKQVYFETHQDIAVEWSKLAELMLDRKIRDKLSSIHQPMEIDQEMRDKDNKNKPKGKEYGDKKRRAVFSSIETGDKVVAKRQIFSNKLDSNFDSKIYEVVKKNGSDVTIQCVKSGVNYRRNVAHLKKIPIGIPQSVSSSLDNNKAAAANTASQSAAGGPSDPTTGTTIQSSDSSSNNFPARRQRKPTQRYGDYVSYK